MEAERMDAASVAHNRRLVREWIDAFNRRDYDAEAEILRTDYVAHAPASLLSEPMDLKGWSDFLAMFVQGFPDLHLEIEDVSADEHMVAQRILFTGTHTGDFNGLPPTNRKVRFSGLEMNLMVDGRVAEHWFQLDQVALLKQLGLVVVPGPRLIPVLISAQVRKLLASRRT
jgi:steroid delta-isomerase-like uncharacterized protein